MSNGEGWNWYFVGDSCQVCDFQGRHRLTVINSGLPKDPDETANEVVLLLNATEIEKEREESQAEIDRLEEDVRDAENQTEEVQSLLDDLEEKYKELEQEFSDYKDTHPETTTPSTEEE